MSDWPVCTASRRPTGTVTVEIVRTSVESGAVITDDVGPLHACGMATGSDVLERRWAVDRLDSGSVLTLTGEFDRMFEGPAAQRLQRAAQVTARPLVLHVEGLTFFDVSTLRLLVAVAADHGGTLPVRNPSPLFRRVVRLIDLDATFPDAPSDSASGSSVRPRGAGHRPSYARCRSSSGGSSRR